LGSFGTEIAARDPKLKRKLGKSVMASDKSRSDRFVDAMPRVSQFGCAIKVAAYWDDRRKNCCGPEAVLVYGLEAPGTLVNVAVSRGAACK